MKKKKFLRIYFDEKKKTYRLTVISKQGKRVRFILEQGKYEAFVSACMQAWTHINGNSGLHL